MAIDFKAKDIIHRIAVKFTPAYLPEAKKPFYLKTVHQPELDNHGVASKAEIYNISTSPKVIEDGLNAGLELMRYLAADGFQIKNDLFTIRTRVPGEYQGNEKQLPEGAYPVVRIQASAEFRNYIKETVKVVFDGKVEREGFIAEAVDESNGASEESITMGRLLSIYGDSLKVDGDAASKDKVGVFLKPAKGPSVKAKDIAVNEPRTIKIVVPHNLKEGTAYTIEIATKSSTRGGTLLKNIRTMKSDFTLTARKDTDGGQS